jgi:hypothetical protein
MAGCIDTASSTSIAVLKVMVTSSSSYTINNLFQNRRSSFMTTVYKKRGSLENQMFILEDQKAASLSINNFVALATF